MVPLAGLQCLMWYMYFMIKLAHFFVPCTFYLDFHFFGDFSHLMALGCEKLSRFSLINNKVSKVAKIRNRYNQVPNLTQDTNGKVTN